MHLRTSFRAKLVTVLAVSVLSLGGLAAVAFRAMNGLQHDALRVEAMAATADTLMETQIAALSLAEDSLALGTDSPDGFRSRLSAVRGDHSAALTEAGEHDPAHAQGLLALAGSLTAYLDTLGQWLAARTELGLDEHSGLRGRFRDAAHALEDGVNDPEFQVSLLQVRRREKDFLLRGDPAYIDKLQTGLERLRRQLRARDGAASLLALVDDYAAAFDAAAQLSLELAKLRSAGADQLGALRSSAAKLESEVEAALDAVQVASEARRDSARTTILGGAVGVAAVLAGLLSWVGIGSTRRLQSIVAMLRDLADGEGDLTRRLPLNYVDCARMKQCGQEECGCYNIRDACWSHVGSMQLVKEKIQCPAVLSGEITNCSTCEVFQASQSDEFDEVANWFNVFADKIRYMVVQVQGSAAELAATSEELSATTTQIASANEQISSQTLSVASGGEEMSVTVKDVAGNTSAVSGAAAGAREAASEGAEVVSQAVTAMQEISAVVEQAAATVGGLGNATDTIGTVVQVIEDIADQTNLLALNAAIEAARAGDHGRGFAVVADEVRKLAEKTVKATQEIGSTIASIQAESRRAVDSIDQGMDTVARGRELGESAGAAIHEIESQVSSAADQTEQIATATEQLSVTIQEVVSNLDEISRGVEQNTSAAAEISETTNAVAGKAEQLRDLVGRFRT